MGKRKQQLQDNQNTDANKKQQSENVGAVNEEIAQEMALSKFQRMMHKEQERDADPMKYAKLGSKTTFLIVILILLLLAGVIFTIVMHFITKNNTDKMPENPVNAQVQNSDRNQEKEQSENFSGQAQEEISSMKNASNATGLLSEHANTYEGRKGTGEYNYGEALQKSLLFYELQRSGDLPEETRCNWRGDSGLSDGADVGLDLTGGLYDAGDHVKFNLPMAYTASTLAWSVFEDYASYEESGQIGYAYDTIRWINDYLIKCHPEKEVFYYQVGDGSADHAWWGPAEVMSMARPSYKVDRSNPGSTVSAAAAASLASASVIFEDEDAEYAKLCKEHAIELYEFAYETKSDAGYTAANGFYSSHSGFYDELAWAGIWLYRATGDTKYLSEAKESFEQTKKEYKWMYCWDDVSLGAAVLIAEETQERAYAEHVEKCLDYWTTGVNGERITYTPKGLAWLDSWGALRYATTAAFVAAVYSDTDVCTPDKQQIYYDFAVSQVNYALGSTGFSYQIGFSQQYPQNPHHRTAQGSYSNNMNEPAEARHTLYGALVGGPDSNDNYSDDVSNYINNEVACDYNAGFTGALAHLYKKFGGQTLVNFGAVEEPDADEIAISACVNTQGADHTEIKAYVMNRSAWPARNLTNVTLRYFVDLSELYETGSSAADVKVTTNYSQGGNATGIHPWDEAAHIYYAEISFGDTCIYPGGQDSYKKEVQFRLTSSAAWDSANDFSYQDIAGTTGSAPVNVLQMALYEDGILIYGNEPSGEGQRPTDTLPQKDSKEEPEESTQPEKQENTTERTVAQADGVSLKVENQSVAGSGSTIAVFFTLKNNGKTPVNLSDFRLEYLFTKDSNVNMNFWCDHSAVSGSAYEAVTDSIKGVFESISDKNRDADTKLMIETDSRKQLQPGDEWTIQIRAAKEDWSNMQFSNDYSAQGVDKILLYYDDILILGTNP